jgi:hypothetical protein
LAAEAEAYRARRAATHLDERDFGLWADRNVDVLGKARLAVKQHGLSTDEHERHVTTIQVGGEPGEESFEVRRAEGH